MSLSSWLKPLENFYLFGKLSHLSGYSVKCLRCTEFALYISCLNVSPKRCDHTYNYILCLSGHTCLVTLVKCHTPKSVMQNIWDDSFVMRMCAFIIGNVRFFSLFLQCWNNLYLYESLWASVIGTFPLGQWPQKSWLIQLLALWPIFSVPSNC